MNYPTIQQCHKCGFEILTSSHTSYPICNNCEEEKS